MKPLLPCQMKHHFDSIKALAKVNPKSNLNP